MSTSTTKELREERKSTHGNWDDGAEISEATIEIWEKAKNWQAMSRGQRASLRMIAHKVHRLLTGDPDLKDTWDDIAGYAHLGIPEAQRDK
ncbi:MAG: hypothetical protein EHM78_02030 [Myxococcaceae bacterium]|nr:MAG: hypothetical protein EHM78_02030 [Myxococcaceae bacterium]